MCIALRRQLYQATAFIPQIQRQESPDEAMSSIKLSQALGMLLQVILTSYTNPYLVKLEMMTEVSKSNPRIVYFTNSQCDQAVSQLHRTYSLDQRDM